MPAAKPISGAGRAGVSLDNPLSVEAQGFGPFANSAMHPMDRARLRLDAVNAAFRAHHQLGENLPKIDDVLVSARKIIALVEDTTVITPEESA